MGLKARRRGDQGAYAGGNPNGDSEYVVHNQRSRGKQSHTLAQVFTRNRVRSTAAGIRGNGLAIGGIDDNQQRDDAEADRHHVLNAESSQRQQQSERRFWSVGGGAE